MLIIIIIDTLYRQVGCRNTHIQTNIKAGNALNSEIAEGASLARRQHHTTDEK
jgi:hypothetical protein